MKFEFIKFIFFGGGVNIQFKIEDSKRFLGSRWGNRMERDHWEDLGVDG